MKIYKAKANSYTDMSGSAIAYDIQAMVESIYIIVKPTNIEQRNKLAECDKAQLKAIAAELETVCKRLQWILKGIY